MKSFLKHGALAAALAAAPSAWATEVVFASNPAPGDAFTNPGPTNTGMSVPMSDWYYNNVRNGGTVGINTAYPRSGNGSVWLTGPAHAKADIEYLPSATADVNGNWSSGATLGLFRGLNALSYEWFRDASSVADAGLHPAIRILLDLDGDIGTTADQGGLVFERAYNGGGAAPTGAWTPESLVGATNVWSFGAGLGFATDIDNSGSGYDDDLAQWKAFLPASAAIIGFSAGIGSGWGAFSGAVDNFAWSIGDGFEAGFNFEVNSSVVPLPSSLLLAAGALFALGRRARPRLAF